MEQNITQSLLCDITQQISRGRPVWAMARANEYLEPNHPLRMALARKALSQQSLAVVSKIGQAIITLGKKYGELSHEEQEEIIKLEPSYSTAPIKIILSNRLGRKEIRKVKAEARRTVIKPRYAFA